MKKTILWTFASVLLVSATIYAITPAKVKVDNTAIKWYSIEEALVAHQKSPKKLFIDMYTDWCGWCKVMDEKTFTNPEVIRYINENFYAVKFDAEQKTPITFKGQTYQFIPSGRRGIHQLAYNLLNKQASYPSFVLLDEKLNSLGILKGYQTPEPFLSSLKPYLAVQ